MSPLRKNSFLRRVKDITLGTTLSITLFNSTAILQSCGNQQSDTEKQQTETSFGQGVRTYITETNPGTFKITDEIQVHPSQAGAVVNYVDGHRDTLSVDAARRLVQTDQSTGTYFRDPAAYAGYHHHGLANTLLWGSLGYLLGRSSAPRYKYEQQFHASAYSNPQVYERANRIGNNVRMSQATRPTGGRSGFFSRSRSSGFSS